MGTQTMASWGIRRIRTPRLDRLARELDLSSRLRDEQPLLSQSGQHLDRAISAPAQDHKQRPSPAPRRVRTRRHTASGFLAQRQEMTRFFEAVPTLPRLLGSRGYLSFEAGKWWGGSFERGGFTHGMTHGDPARGGRHGDAGLSIGREGMQPVFDFIGMARARRRLSSCGMPR